MDTDYQEWAKDRGVDTLPIKEHPTRITMDDYGLELAAVVAKRAACTRRQVGAVIIGPDKRIMSTGYNGMQPGAVECSDGGCPRGAYTHEQIPGLLGNGGHEVPCTARHAERNAIEYINPRMYRPDWLPRSTIYITCQPCPDCEELCKKKRLRVVWPWRVPRSRSSSSSCCWCAWRAASG